MTHRTLPDELDAAADSIADHKQADLQVLLRRAALRLREASGGLALDPPEDAVVDEMVMELRLSRSEVLKTIVRDWLIGHSRPHANETGDVKRN